MVVPYDAANRIQSQTRPLANTLGGEKGLKDVRQNVGRDSRSVVSNLDEHAVEVTRGPHAQLTLPLHGLDRVGYEVCPNLIELTAKSANAREIFGVRADYFYSVFEAVVENRQRTLKPLMQVDLLHGSLVHVRVLLDSSHQI